MMHNNSRFIEFLGALGARGVSHQWLWEARRDGRKPAWPKYPADIAMIGFNGRGFQPKILVAVVIDYGDRDGFGLFTDDAGNSIEADVDRIAGDHAKVTAS